MAAKWPRAAAALIEHDFDAETILRYWDDLDVAEKEAAACEDCRGLDECRNRIRGMREVLEVHWGHIYRAVTPCRYMQVVMDEEVRRRRLQSAHLERKFWERTFDVYRPQNDSQRYALERCRTWAEEYTPKETRTGLYLVGDVGVGKTHLAAAILLRIMERFKDLQPMMLPMVDFMEELRDAVGEEDVNGKVDEAVRAPVLVMDDLGGNLEWDQIDGKRVLRPTSRGQHPVTDFERRTLYRLINRRYEAGLPVVVTTNCPPDVLEAAYGTRTVSRLIEMTEGIAINGEDYRKRKLLGG